MLHIPQFCGRNRDEHENVFVKKIRSAHCGITRQDKAISVENTVVTMVGRDDSHTQVIPDSIQRVCSVHGEWINSIHMCYGGRIICHMVEFKRYNGRMINDTLPPYKMIVAKLVLTERELVVIRKVLDGFSTG